jgi:hypothetical protein
VVTEVVVLAVSPLVQLIFLEQPLIQYLLVLVAPLRVHHHPAATEEVEVGLIVLFKDQIILK